MIWQVTFNFKAQKATTRYGVWRYELFPIISTLPCEVQLTNGNLNSTFGKLWSRLLLLETRSFELVSSILLLYQARLPETKGGSTVHPTPDMGAMFVALLLTVLALAPRSPYVLHRRWISLYQSNVWRVGKFVSQMPG
jgi:hypothetical protein